MNEIVFDFLNWIWLIMKCRPFLFRRSFYPDGNQTRDQVIYQVDSQNAVLGRTYYQTVEFIIPQGYSRNCLGCCFYWYFLLHSLPAIMQPIWESAKSRSGVINYRSNYHRAVYAIGYDNYNDIYNQRWRKEVPNLISYTLWFLIVYYLRKGYSLRSHLREYHHRSSTISKARRVQLGRLHMQWPWGDQDCSRAGSCDRQQ